MIFTFILLLLLPLLLLEGSEAGEGVRRGLELAYRAVLPSLFPTMTVCGMIGELAEYIPLPPAWTLWITSHLCGFPLGTRMLARAYHRGLLSKEQTLRLSACCANASPAFLIVYVGEKILGSSREGLILFFCQITVSLFLALGTGALKITAPPPPEDRPLLTAITSGFSGAAMGGLTLTGYIAFFSMAAALLKNIPFFSYLYGFLELTGGIRGGLFLAAAMTGFSGCSVLLQNAAFLTEENLSVLPMILGKCVYTAAMPPLAFLLNNLTNS